MAFVLKHEGTKQISLEEFCRINGLIYIGQVVDRQTHRCNRFPVVQAKEGKYYTAEVERSSDRGNITFSVTFKETNYSQRKYKLMEKCSIIIDVWDKRESDEHPIYRLAFLRRELPMAKESIKAEYELDITFNGKKISREELLEK